MSGLVAIWDLVRIWAGWGVKAVARIGGNSVVLPPLAQACSAAELRHLVADPFVADPAFYALTLQLPRCHRRTRIGALCLWDCQMPPPRGTSFRTG